MASGDGKRYDEVPYESNPFPQTHPRWLATVGNLFGMGPPPVETARVLEIGCASGGNLIPMAETLPGSQCVGVDHSARQIADGQAFLQSTGLQNIELRHASILDIDESYGEFDYIVCHGVFSWVERPLQEKIFEICAERLSPNGVAYISYNTYPGWHIKGMMRDMMKFHASRFTTPEHQISQSRALLNVLAQMVPEEDNPYGLLLRQESRQLQNYSDYYVYHEQLEESNNPVYFHEFVRSAAERGLQFLAEADVHGMLRNRLPEEVQTVLKEIAPNLILTEQYMDFFRNRTFRQSLLCRQGVPLQRKLNGKAFEKFSFATALTPEAKDEGPTPVRFEAPGWPTISVRGEGASAVFRTLRDAWPEYLAWQELERRVRQRLSSSPPTPETGADFIAMLGGRFMEGLVTITVARPPCSHRAGERPRAGLVARKQIELGRSAVTNLHHENVSVGRMERQLLPLLDGTRTRPELVKQMRDILDSKCNECEGSTLPAQFDEKTLEQALSALAGAAFLYA